MKLEHNEIRNDSAFFQQLRDLSDIIWFELFVKCIMTEKA
jgi:hypothetical protein